MKEEYLAIIGDIIDSRHLEDRAAVQSKLEVVLKDVNTDYARDIKSKFLITLGDEFQGLLIPTSEAFSIVNTILDQMYPVKIRFGLGHGKITTSIKETAIGMDGPAFYAARQALESFKKTKEPGLRLYGALLDSKLLRGVNALFDSLFLIRQFWPENFKAALPLLRQDQTQQDVADAIKVSQATVSWMLHRAKWRQVKAIENDLMELLDSIFLNKL